MVGGFDDVQVRSIAQARADGPKEREVSECVASALEEEHGHSDFGKVVGALGSRLVGRVKRESEEDDSANFVERVLRGGGGRHSATH